MKFLMIFLSITFSLFLLAIAGYIGGKEEYEKLTKKDRERFTELYNGLRKLDSLNKDTDTGNLKNIIRER